MGSFSRFFHHLQPKINLAPNQLFFRQKGHFLGLSRPSSNEAMAEAISLWMWPFLATTHNKASKKATQGYFPLVYSTPCAPYEILRIASILVGFSYFQQFLQSTMFWQYQEEKLLPSFEI